MIVFDLKCGVGHVFEAWFGSSRDYEDQRQRGLLSCPLCGDDEIGKAVMAPSVPAKGNSKNDSPPSPAAIKAALAAIAEAQRKALDGSTWVGRSFATKARAMHDGDIANTPIHGEASAAEARALIEDGVPVAPLPFPVAPPQTRN
jgi:hypothetical protein